MRIFNSKNYFLKDVIHKEIVFKNPWVIELLKCKEITRLIKIKQLGLTYRLFPNATHNRFVHSLGVYAIVNMVVTQLPNIFNNNEINELSTAALLHDIGHGPHSHAWECYTNLKHEKYYCIVEKDSIEINGLEQEPHVHQPLNSLFICRSKKPKNKCQRVEEIEIMRTTKQNNYVVIEQRDCIKISGLKKQRLIKPSSAFERRFRAIL